MRSTTSENLEEKGKIIMHANHTTEIQYGSRGGLLFGLFVLSANVAASYILYTMNSNIQPLPQLLV
jgi:hypothetical protein